MDTGFNSMRSRLHQPLQLPLRRYRRGAAGSGGRECAPNIAGSQTLLKIPSCKIAVKKASIESVAGAGRVDRANANGFRPHNPPVLKCNGTTFAKLDNGTSDRPSDLFSALSMLRSCVM